MSKTSELFPRAKVVQMPDGTSVEVKLLTLKDFDLLLDLVVPVYDDLSSGANAQGVDISNATLMLKLISKHRTAMYGAMTLLSNVGRDELNDFTMDKVVILATSVIGHNKDFFIQNVLPLLAEVKQRVVGQNPQS